MTHSTTPVKDDPGADHHLGSSAQDGPVNLRPKNASPNQLSGGVVSAARYVPILVRNRMIRHPMYPVAFDWVKVTVVRDGSAIAYSEFGQKHVNIGDVVVLGASTLCGWEPEGQVTITTIDFDPDYLIDQVFWQYADILHDRLDAEGFARTIYSEPAQVLRLGEDRANLLLPWLDELVRLSADGNFAERFHRMQALWFSLADVIAPYVKVSPVRLSPTQRARARPTLPRHRRSAPMRSEAMRVRSLLRDDPARTWPLSELARTVYLSPKQLSRIFSDAFGLTPRAYQTRLRVAEMAQLLRNTDISINEAGRLVGWSSRSRAHDAFKECTGLSPRQYRQIGVCSATS